MIFGDAVAILIRAILAWALIIAAESVHGALRRILLDPDTAFALRQVSVGVAVLIVFAVTWVSDRWMAVRGTGALLGVGLLWVILTLAFEFGLGRALGYDLSKGNIMPLGLLATVLAPWIVARLRSRSAA